MTLVKVNLGIICFYHYDNRLQLKLSLGFSWTLSRLGAVGKTERDTQSEENKTKVVM